MDGTGLGTIIHLLGFVTGAALYAMLLALALRRPAPRSAGEEGGVDRLALLTAALGLTWNVIALVAFGARAFEIGPFPPLVIAIAYCALGFLPAAVVHSALTSERNRRQRSRRALIVGAYAVSAVAATLMLWQSQFGALPSRAGLRLLTWAFIGIAVPLLFMTRREPRAAKAWWIVALAVFAVSALHLSGAEHGGDSWLVQLIGHHASLALVFAILYQDYRFALADLFLKRGLTLLLVVGVVAVLFFTVVQPMLLADGAHIDTLTAGTLIVLWIATASLYPAFRRSVAWFVDRVVLRRSDYSALKGEIARWVALEDDIDALLAGVCARLPEALSAAEVRCEEVAVAESLLDGDLLERPGHVALPVPTTEPPRYALVVGRLAGGRRLLSDDVEMLQTVARMTGRRIDAIRIQQERMAQHAREQEISKLATEAELRALRAQINPHFLFNALNTIGYLVQTSPDVARTTLMKLTSLLRGVLRSGASFITLGEEVDLVNAYLDVEKSRFEERLRIRLDVPEELRGLKVPPLLIQPLVENALKHGIAGSRGGGEILVSARLEHDGVRDALLVTVRNTGAVAYEADVTRGRLCGVGLRNIEERLRLLFGASASLALRTGSGSATVAEIRLPIGRVLSTREMGEQMHERTTPSAHRG